MIFGTLDQALKGARRLHQRHAAITGVMPSEDRERYYAESRILAALFGIPQTSLPSSWEEFGAYNRAMWGSTTLTMTPGVRAIAEQILKGAKAWRGAPKWYGVVTAGMLPPRLRKAFGLPYGEAEQRIADAAIGRIQRIYPALPERLRYVGPYQEAVARLSGRTRPSLLTQWANGLWIGRASIE